MTLPSETQLGKGVTVASNRTTMGFWEALWAVIGGLLLASMFGLGTHAFVILAVLVAYFGGGALYWKMRLTRQRRERRRRAGP
jgi:hypothetical protein